MEEISQFAGDIAPFFWDQPISFIDVGFGDTNVIDSMLASRLRVQHLHLLADHSQFTSLVEWKKARSRIEQEKIHLQCSSGDHSATCEVVDSDGAKSTVGLYSQSLESLIESLPIDKASVVRINADKVDVRLLEDAREWLSDQPLNMIVVEVGLLNENQQDFPRAFDCLLGECGYRIMNVYSNKPQEAAQSPLLEKISVAYISEVFLQSNPYRIVRELLNVQKECQQLQLEKRLLEQDSQIAKKKHGLLIAQLAQVQNQLEEAALSKAKSGMRDRQERNTTNKLALHRYDALVEILTSFKYCFIDIFVRAIKEPGRNTVLMPYRLVKLIGEEVLIRDAKERRKERLGLISQQCSTEKLVG